MQAELRFTVEVGPDGDPVLKVHAGDRTIPIDLTPAQSRDLGRALLAVSTVCSSAEPPPAGTPIDNCHFPVKEWATGRSIETGRPVLVVRVLGGAELMFQFSPAGATECAASLRNAAALAEDASAARDHSWT
ncbi:hypothetical protein [Methylobacterium isbiliense]|jgi:hypothetical protein|uniref:Uncharacterized protein n=1 Tax=Methylobacterium isbiliense TaxID=315478 RepID=A0ABQ4SHN7_9HYPH|nr:hypothetical protein [Methylobacterium isbiliense]MDN3624744.1 hypothetical protein [Methylobacterium isbiliense]GJE02684.1 hypothetical protein GMJLKIPL_4633 [Methylobacterium isbiliense]